MSEATGMVSLDLLGRLVREVQAETRSLRSEQALLHRILNEAVTALMDRIGTSEALTQTGVDRLMLRLDQTERSIEERLTRIEKLLTEKSGEG